MRTLPILFASILGAHQATAQCGTVMTDGPVTPHTAQRPAFERGGPAPFIVPTIVHVHYGGAILPLGILHVQPLLDQCNADLRGTNPDIVDVVPAFAGLVGDLGIELRLATRDEQGNCMSGVRYHDYDPDQQGADLVTATLNTRGYLNIHVTPAGNSFATLPGLASEPYNATDFIVLSTAQTDLEGRTLAHELGHFGGLYHTFGLTNQTGTCGEDYIADTPETAGSPLDCVLDRSECNEGVVENVQNHMDYSDCRIMFTQGQAAHVVDVMSDPDLVRAGLSTEANLLLTGVTDPSSCAITGGMHYRPSVSCDGVTMHFRAMAEHAVADSVRWTFTGGSPATSTDDHAAVLYTNSGTFPVQLTVYGGGTSATVDDVVVIEVPQTGQNGLAPVNDFPFTEGFEGDFSLPQQHMFAAYNPEAAWQPFAQAGFASAQSLFVPAQFNTASDTIDLVLGNFDFAPLSQTTVQLRVATTNYAMAGWCTFQLLFRDQCSNIFTGDVWMTRQLYELAGDNGSGFVPTNDAQWTLVSATFPEWAMATGAELKLRLVRAPMFTGQIPEAFFIDDVYVGELPITTGLASAGSGPDFVPTPNPASDVFTLTMNGPGATHLQVLDAGGRIVERRVVSAPSTAIDGSTWPAGVYTIVVQKAGAAPARARLVIAR